MAKLKKNIAGFYDELGRFRPIRDNPRSTKVPVSRLRVMEITPKSFGVFLRRYCLKKFRSRPAAEAYKNKILGRRKNPADPITAFAGIMGGLSSALHIHDVFTRRKARRGAKAAGKTRAKRNGGEIRKDRSPAKPNPKARASGDLFVSAYALTLKDKSGKVRAVYVVDESTGKDLTKVKTMAAAKSFAKRKGISLAINPRRVRKTNSAKLKGKSQKSNPKRKINAPSGLPVRANAADFAKARSLGKKNDFAGMQKLVRSKLFVGGSIADLWDAYQPGITKRNTTTGKEQRYSRNPKSGKRLAISGKRKVNNPSAMQRAWDIYEQKGLSVAVDYVRHLRKELTATQRATLIDSIRMYDADSRKVNTTTGKEHRYSRNPKSTIRKSKSNGIVSRYLGRRKAKAEYGRELRLQAAIERSRKRRKAAESRAHNPKSKTRNPKSAVPRRRTYERFQGRRATSATYRDASPFAPRRLDQLGDLVELKVNGRIIKFNPSRAKLCAAGGKLWIAGVKIAKPNPAGLANGIDPIGYIDHVVYTTHKPHHGDAPNQHYIHRMGEETGHKPILAADKQGYPIIRGGRYKIESRGIVN